MATTRWDDIEKNIIGYISDNWSSTQVAYPNIVFDPSGLSAWIQVHVIPVDAYQHTITGGNTGQMHKGILHINLYVLRNIGTGLITGYIDDLCDLFNHHSITVSGEYVIQFFVPRPNPGGPDGDWWKTPLTVEFQYLE